MDPRLALESVGALAPSPRNDHTLRRELAHRSNDGFDVTLFWTKASNRVTISVLDVRCATALEFDVDGADALDAFNHPYAYAATAAHATTPRRTR